MWQLLLLLAGLIPAVILLAAVQIGRWKRKRRGERQPLSEKLLRPAGYTLQRNLEGLNDSFNTWYFGACFFTLPAIGFFALTPKDFAGRISSLVIFGLASAGCAIVAWRRILQIRSHRCGLLGEQAVAEQLQPLFVAGFQVFHDILCEKPDRKWNIDHVAIGPAGVFAIETKYRTKKPGRNGSRNCEVTFDGEKITYANGYYDAKALRQARNNARWLAKELSNATGETVSVQPIVALPGWFVTRKADSDVKVLSGKEVAGYIMKEPGQLSPASVQRISHQVEQLCRDVEI